MSRIRLANGNDWASRSSASQMLGAVAVPVNTRFTESEVEYVITDSGAVLRLRAGAAAPRRRAVRRRRPRAQRPRRHLLHERHDGVPEGRDDDPRELPVELRDVHVASSASPATTTIRQPRLGAAVPRHRLQQPADHHDPDGRHDGDHARVRGAAVPPRDRRRADQRAHLGAGDLLAGDEPAELRRLRRERRRAGSATAARRRRPTSSRVCARRSPTPGSATASA